MIMAKLFEYGRELVRPGFRPNDKIRWALAFSTAGELLAIHPLHGATEKDPMVFESAPYVKISSGSIKEEKGQEADDETEEEDDVEDEDDIAVASDDDSAGLRSQFLYDSAKGAFLLEAEAALKPTAQRRYDDFRSLLRDAACGPLPQLGPVVDALSDPERMAAIRERMAEAGVKPTDNVTIMIDGDLLLNDDSWHDWWTERVAQMPEPELGREGICVVTGERTRPPLTHDRVSLGVGKPVPLLSFDKGAFRSYGLRQGENCTVKPEVAAAYVAALNRLASRDDNVTKFGGVRILHWYDDGGPNDEFAALEGERTSWLDLPSSAEEDAAAAELIGAPNTGRRTPDLGQNHYTLIGINPVPGRYEIFMMERGPIQRLRDNIAGWFRDLEIVDFNGRPCVRPKMSQLITAMVAAQKPRQKFKDWIKPVHNLSKVMFRAAICGGTIPDVVVTRVLPLVANFWTADLMNCDDEKKRKDEYFATLRRMALVRAHINRRREMSDHVAPSLDRDLRDPCYNVGRLLAVMDDLQETAHGRAVGSRMSRSFRTLMLNPVTYARLLGDETPLLQKVRKTRTLGEPVAQRFTTLIDEIMMNIRSGVVPIVAPLREQEMFALGFHCQRAELAAERAERIANYKAKKEAKLATSEPDEA